MGSTVKPMAQLRFPLPISLPKKGNCNFRVSITATTSTLTHSHSHSAIPTPKPNPKSTLKKRKRYRKLHPGESTGITEEMRFVAMRLHNPAVSHDQSNFDAWHASMEGFISYLVDTHLIFATLQRIVDESDNVSCEFNISSSYIPLIALHCTFFFRLLSSNVINTI